MKLYAAIFYTKDLDRAITFYESTVGLPPAVRQGDNYASFKLENGAELGIKIAGKEREVPGMQTAIIECESIEKLYSRLNGQKVPFYKELEKAPWGTTFSILDPDGNKLELVGKD